MSLPMDLYRGWVEKSQLSLFGALSVPLTNGTEGHRELRMVLHLKNERRHPWFHPHGVQLWGRQGWVSGVGSPGPHHTPHTPLKASTTTPQP